MQVHAGRWLGHLTGMGTRPPLYLSLLTLTVYLFWRGYDYAISDHEEILPYLLRLLDPSLYRSDWFVNVQLEAFGPRTLFVLIAWLPAKLLGPYAAIFGMYVASWFGTSMALYALGMELTRERLAATICVVLALLLTPKFTMGGNDTVTWILTPSMTAWPFSLWGLVFFVRGRTVLAAVLMGIATWLQALVGLQMAGLCTLLLLWKYGIGRHPVYAFAGSFGLSGLPALGPLLWFQLIHDPVESIRSYFYILFEFRAPHHYMPTSFIPESMVGFLILLILGLVTLSQLSGTHRILLQRIFITIAATCIFSFVCTEIIPITPIAKLQLFKLTVIIKIVCVILVSNAAAQLILRFHRRAVDLFFDHMHYVLGATILIVATLVMISPNALGIRPAPAHTPSEQIARWAHDSTDVGALFAVPPNWEEFRSQSRRSIVVNFKAVPFHEPYMSQWFTRVLDMAPISPPRQGGFRVMPDLDQAFFALSPQEVLDLSAQYDNFAYIIRRKSDVPDGFEVVYEVGDFAVWRILSEP